MDLLLAPIMKISTDGITAGYYFFDLNGKFNYNFSNKDKLYVSAYFGRDKFHMKDKWKDEGDMEIYSLGLFWQNATATARWNHVFTNKIFSNLSAIFSDYKMNTYSDYTYRYQDYGQTETIGKELLLMK